MTDNPLKSLTNYSRFIAELLNRLTVEHSTLTIWSDSPYTGVAEGEVHFIKGFRLRVREELDFSEGIIASYGDFPHPNDSNLASTYPHHKHIPPSIKHNRIPAPEISFTQCNLPMLIREIEKQVTGEES
jgi:hypothetical protein